MQGKNKQGRQAARTKRKDGPGEVGKKEHKEVKQRQPGETGKGIRKMAGRN